MEGQLWSARRSGTLFGSAAAGYGLDDAVEKKSRRATGRNNRVDGADFPNRSCAFTAYFESTLSDQNGNQALTLVRSGTIFAEVRCPAIIAAISLALVAGLF
jgi:hypothetical protein